MIRKIIQVFVIFLTLISASSLAQTVDLSLKAGWNMIGMSLDPKITPSQLALHINEIDSIWGYKDGGWVGYLIDIQGVEIDASLNQFEKGGAYWVHLKSDPIQPITLTSSDQATEMNLVYGWNFLSVGSSIESLGEWLTQNDIDSAWGREEERWMSHVAGVPVFLNSLQQLEPSKGYYLYQSQEEPTTIGYSTNLDSSDSQVAISGTEAIDILVAGDNGVLLSGQGGADILVGGIGNDTLGGGVGSDLLIGGMGADTFLLKVGGGGSSASDGDLIIDFQVGTDLIAGAGVSFSELTIADGTGRYSGSAVVSQGDEFLAILQGVNATSFTGSDFIASTNNTPAANGANITVEEGVTYYGRLSAFDVDGDILSYVVVEQPSKGTLIIESDGAFSYASNSGALFSDSFTYKVNDGIADSDVAIVDISLPMPEVTVVLMDDSTITPNIFKIGDEIIIPVFDASETIKQIEYINSAEEKVTINLSADGEVESVEKGNTILAYTRYRDGYVDITARQSNSAVTETIATEIDAANIALIKSLIVELNDLTEQSLNTTVTKKNSSGYLGFSPYATTLSDRERLLIKRSAVLLKVATLTAGTVTCTAAVAAAVATGGALSPLAAYGCASMILSYATITSKGDTAIANTSFSAGVQIARCLSANVSGCVDLGTTAVNVVLDKQVAEVESPYTYTLVASDDYWSEEGEVIEFTITRSGSGTSGQPFVFVDTVDTTAIAGDDYKSLQSQIELFTADETSKTILVETYQDDDNSEGDETFELRMYADYDDISSNNKISSETGTIVNSYSYSIESTISAIEGETISFTIARNGTGSASTVYVMTEDSDSSNSATAGSDYNEVVETAIIFDTTDTEKIVLVSTKKDNDGAEGNEVFWLNLYKSQESVQTDNWSVNHVATIIDDFAYSLESSVSITEGDSASLTITRSGTGGASEIFVATEDDTATGGEGAETGVDYNALSSYSIYFDAETNTAVIPLETYDDDDAEGDETFRVNIASSNDDLLGSNFIDSTTLVTISDNDQLPAVLFNGSYFGGSIADDSSDELSFYIFTDIPVGPKDITVPYTVSGGTSYTLTPPSPIVIPANEGIGIAYFTLTPSNIVSTESEEEIVIELGTPDNGILFDTDTSYGVTITNKGYTTVDTCKLDDITGLLWEPKGSSGIHDRDRTFGWESVSNVFTTQGLIDASNYEQLCGRSNWRLPTADEMINAIGGRSISSVDTCYSWQNCDFKEGRYWTSDIFDDNSAWYVSETTKGIGIIQDETYLYYTTYRARLVSGN